MNNELAKQWQNQFEKEHGRRPYVDEFLAAKENGFADVVESTPEASVDETPIVNPMKVWALQFEATHGRKPSADEFSEAKAADFKMVQKPVDETPVVAPVTPAASVEQPAMSQQMAQMAQMQQMAGMPGAPVPPAPRKKMKTVTKVLLGVGAVVLLALGGAFAWGQNYFSKDSEAQRLATGLATQKEATYAGLLKWSDTQKNLSKAEVSPTVRYMKQEKFDNADKIADALVRNDIPAMKLEETGRNYLIFPRFELVVKPVTITAETNQNQLTLKVNGVDEGQVDRSKRMSHRAPGVYVFEATSRIGNKDVPVKDARTITADETIGLDIEVISFDVESNLKTGDLYIGQTKIGTLKDGKYKVKNEPITDSIDVYVAQNLGNKKIESEHQELTKDRDHGVLQLNAEGVITESEARSALSSAMQAIDSYAYDERVPSDLSMFVGGSSNTAFQNFKDNVDHNLNRARRTANSIDYDFNTLRSVSQTSDVAADFVGEIDVDFYFTSDTDKAKRTSGRLSQTFEITGTLAYDSSSDTWKVDTISEKQPKLNETSNVS